MGVRWAGSEWCRGFANPDETPANASPFLTEVPDTGST